MTGYRTRALLAAILLSGCVHRIDTPQPAILPPVAAAAPMASSAAGARKEESSESPARVVVTEPLVITATQQEAALSDLPAEEQHRQGSAALAAGDNARALLLFARVADMFVESPRRPDALFHAGILHMKMRQWEPAAQRFAQAIQAFGAGSPQGVESRFRLADAAFFHGDVELSLRTLADLAVDPALSGVRRLEAETKRGVVLWNANRPLEAEAALKLALDDVREHLSTELPDTYLPSQAEFHLGEIFRQRFLAGDIDAGKSKADLMAVLDDKASRLQSAQGHYLRCIRLGHPEWATASGFRIGDLYQQFHTQIVAARPPPELNDEESVVYLSELRAHVRPLIATAADIYERTLATAERVHATNPFVAQTRTQLEALKATLAATPTAPTTDAKARTEPRDDPAVKTAKGHSGRREVPPQGRRR